MDWVSFTFTSVLIDGECQVYYPFLICSFYCSLMCPAPDSKETGREGEMMTEVEKQTPICSHSLPSFSFLGSRCIFIQGDTFITRLSLGETDVTCMDCRCMSLQREMKGEPRRGESWEKEEHVKSMQCLADRVYVTWGTASVRSREREREPARMISWMKEGRKLSDPSMNVFRSWSLSSTLILSLLWLYHPVFLSGLKGRLYILLFSFNLCSCSALDERMFLFAFLCGDEEWKIVRDWGESEGEKETGRETRRRRSQGRSCSRTRVRV